MLHHMGGKDVQEGVAGINHRTPRATSGNLACRPRSSCWPMRRGDGWKWACPERLPSLYKNCFIHPPHASPYKQSWQLQQFVLLRREKAKSGLFCCALRCWGQSQVFRTTGRIEINGKMEVFFAGADPRCFKVSMRAITRFGTSRQTEIFQLDLVYFCSSF